MHGINSGRSPTTSLLMLLLPDIQIVNSACFKHGIHRLGSCFCFWGRVKVTVKLFMCRPWSD